MSCRESLCLACQHRRDIVSGRGSRFLLCELAKTERGYAKYPSQPVVRCAGFSPAVSAEGK